jgi:hypothetical protein
LNFLYFWLYLKFQEYLQPISQNIIYLYLCTCLSAEPVLLFIEKTHHLNQKVIKEDLRVILTLVEIHLELILKGALKIEVQSKLTANALLTYFCIKQLFQEWTKNHIWIDLFQTCLWNLEEVRLLTKLDKNLHESNFLSCQQFRQYQVHDCTRLVKHPL